MSKSHPSSGKFFTISKRDARAGSGMFVERSSKDGSFSTKSMDGKVFDGARNAAGSKLREVSGKFLSSPGHKK